MAFNHAHTVGCETPRCRAKADCDPATSTARSMADLIMETHYRQGYSRVNRRSLVARDRDSYNDAPMGQLADRLIARMTKLGLSQAELARRVKVSQPTIQAIASGETQNTRHLSKIAIELETTPAYLLGETDDPVEGALVLSDREAIAEKMGLALVPEYELGYSMGGGAVFDDYRQTGIRVFDQDWLRGLMRGSFTDLFVAQGEGDSMEPTLKDGDVVLIDTAQKDIRQQDRIWAVSYGDLGMIKRVRRMPGGTYQLLSDNPNVSPVNAADDEMFVVGRVIWIGRRI